ncbi:two-component system chemotaxis response regulator CheB [Thioclava sp. ES.031]|uniref:protein-glutamate methylesterase/protein-glutamine glutaminase n=1 Tax=Thioclava sp. ES.031 TaxID=1798203 RepID=UPI000BF28C74|nr:chemotaxis response regulator protein-glutamate methylesterase [Thioclava sp. ES.031]PFG63247.1 two-component system chemotaxis response regulator CheB [Thioclava sp. ES.031]
MPNEVPPPKRVLIVDDSATMRQLIRARITTEPRLAVIGEAADAFEAREKIKSLLPDVITLDVEMPRMNGLDFLERLMRLRPIPVVMVSTETHKGSRSAIEALALGAIDCVGKPRFGQLEKSFESLPDILLTAASARLPQKARDRASIIPAQNFHWGGQFVLIGSSTGGVDALETVLKGFPDNCPPTLIAQHMPESFLASFAERLDRKIAPSVSLGKTGTPLAQGHVYLAPGGATHLTIQNAKTPYLALIEAEKRNGHRPSVDVLFESAVEMAANAIVVLLTGMGRDGAEGMLKLRKAGAHCFAQDEATSIVFGMPRAALELGAAAYAMPLGNIAPEILRRCAQSPTTANKVGEV